jgi:hypothetical protein
MSAVTDDLPRRPRGRPPLKNGEPSVPCYLRLCASDYSKAVEIAKKHRSTVPAVLRAAFKKATRRPDTLDEP